jgi:riboflavin synthase
MFTGIVQAQARLLEMLSRENFATLRLEFPEAFLGGLTRGASICVDGVCLTATEFNERQACFDVMLETLRVTTLGQLRVGALLNVERAAKQDAEIGGHPLSGHIDGLAQIVKIHQPQDNYVLTFEVPETLLQYVFRKGYIALNGTSLTIADVDRSQKRFEVWLIPETLRVTTFGAKQVGDFINVEVERNTQVIVDTVHSFLARLLPEVLATGKLSSLGAGAVLQGAVLQGAVLQGGMQQLQAGLVDSLSLGSPTQPSIPVLESGVKGK